MLLSSRDSTLTGFWICQMSIYALCLTKYNIKFVFFCFILLFYICALFIEKRKKLHKKGMIKNLVQILHYQ